MGGMAQRPSGPFRLGGVAGRTQPTSGEFFRFFCRVRRFHGGLIQLDQPYRPFLDCPRMIP